jgi:hypothetical protein
MTILELKTLQIIGIIDSLGNIKAVKTTLSDTNGHSNYFQSVFNKRWRFNYYKGIEKSLVSDHLNGQDYELIRRYLIEKHGIIFQGNYFDRICTERNLIENT